MIKPQFVLPQRLKASIYKDNTKQVKYISNYFKNSILYQPKDEKFFFGLPHPYVVPDNRHFREFFYWDSFFILLGLLLYQDTKELCKGIVQNFAYEIKRFGRIPNSNAFFSLSRSQTPYFALSIWEYLKKYPDEVFSRWVANCVEKAIEEYEGYWLATDKRYADHKTENNLSRYWDVHFDTDIFAEYESGWDTTSRFGGACMSINPIDLNSQLYIYEKFFHWYYTQAKDVVKSKKWEVLMGKRKKLIDKYCWDEKEGMYFDYDFVRNKKTDFITAASFFPLYAGMADTYKGKRSIPKLLAVSEQEGGIVETEKVTRDASYKNQWDYPHGWAPHQYIAYVALKNYGFDEEAERLRKKWLQLCDYWFKKDKCFYEKYNVVKIGSRVVSKTPPRPGFGWTNSIYLKFLFTG